MRVVEIEKKDDVALNGSICKTSHISLVSCEQERKIHHCLCTTQLKQMSVDLILNPEKSPLLLL